jgi:hypothetical protein
MRRLKGSKAFNEITSTEWLFCDLFQTGQLEDPYCDICPKSDADDLGLDILLVQRGYVNTSDFVLQSGVPAQNQLFVFYLTKHILIFCSQVSTRVLTTTLGCVG